MNSGRMAVFVRNPFLSVAIQNIAIMEKGWKYDHGENIAKYTDSTHIVFAQRTFFDGEFIKTTKNINRIESNNIEWLEANNYVIYDVIKDYDKIIEFLDKEIEPEKYVFGDAHYPIIVDRKGIMMGDKPIGFGGLLFDNSIHKTTHNTTWIQDLTDAVHKYWELNDVFWKKQW